MTDLEITRLCAEAMCIKWSSSSNVPYREAIHPSSTVWDKGTPYDPLHDDAQAMALVKKFKLGINRAKGKAPWDWVAVVYDAPFPVALAGHSSLNRAICECVAKMQLAKRSDMNNGEGRP